jgi:hypothetical protein
MGKRTDAASTFGSPAALHPLCPANPGQNGCRVRGFPSLPRDKFGLVKSEQMKRTPKQHARSRVPFPKPCHAPDPADWRALGMDRSKDAVAAWHADEPPI